MRAAESGCVLPGEVDRAAYQALRGLWAAVIERAVLDFEEFNRSCVRGGVTPSAELRSSEGVDAFRWLYSRDDLPAREFAWVCDWVDVSPAAVREALARKTGRSVESLRDGASWRPALASGRRGRSRSRAARGVVNG